MRRLPNGSIGSSTNEGEGEGLGGGTYLFFFNFFSTFFLDFDPWGICLMMLSCLFGCRSSRGVGFAGEPVEPCRNFTPSRACCSLISVFLFLEPGGRPLLFGCDDLVDDALCVMGGDGFGVVWSSSTRRRLVGGISSDLESCLSGRLITLKSTGAALRGNLDILNYGKWCE